MSYTVMWAGFSFNQYNHYVYELTHKFKKGPGNYIYCSIDNHDVWVPIYIGETNDLAKISDNHHKLKCILGLEATHIHAHTNSGGKQARQDEKNDLVHIYDPICQYF